MVASGKQGTTGWLLPDTREVAGDGTGQQVEAKMKIILMVCYRSQVLFCKIVFRSLCFMKY